MPVFNSNFLCSRPNKLCFVAEFAGLEPGIFLGSQKRITNFRDFFILTKTRNHSNRGKHPPHQTFFLMGFVKNLTGYRGRGWKSGSIDWLMSSRVRAWLTWESISMHMVKWCNSSLWSRYYLHVAWHDVLLCEVNWWRFVTLFLNNIESVGLRKV